MSARRRTTHLAGLAAGEELDSSAWHAELFERIAARVQGYFRRVVWNRDEAEDLAQQTFLLLERSLREGTYDPSRSFNAWLWLKAHTVYAGWCRKRGKAMRRLPEEHLVAAEGDPVVAKGEELDARTVLQELQTRLGAETYECFLLFYQAGLSKVRIAEITGRNRKTVASRIREAHALVERLLGGKGRP